MKFLRDLANECEGVTNEEITKAMADLDEIEPGEEVLQEMSHGARAFWALLMRRSKQVAHLNDLHIQAHQVGGVSSHDDAACEKFQQDFASQKEQIETMRALFWTALRVESGCAVGSIGIRDQGKVVKMTAHRQQPAGTQILDVLVSGLFGTSR